MCKLCGGSQICEHDTFRSQCYPCKGTQICEHLRQRALCILCRGSQICVHDRQRALCRECKGSQICVHDRQRNQCKACGGGSLCQHLVQRAHCRKCKAQAFTTAASPPTSCADPSEPVPGLQGRTPKIRPYRRFMNRYHNNSTAADGAENRSMAPAAMVDSAAAAKEKGDLRSEPAFARVQGPPPPPRRNRRQALGGQALPRILAVRPDPPQIGEPIRGAGGSPAHA